MQKVRCDRFSIFKPELCKFWSNFECDRKIVDGTGARTPSNHRADSCVTVREVCVCGVGVGWGWVAGVGGGGGVGGVGGWGGGVGGWGGGVGVGGVLGGGAHAWTIPYRGGASPGARPNTNLEIVMLASALLHCDNKIRQICLDYDYNVTFFLLPAECHYHPLKRRIWCSKQESFRMLPPMLHHLVLLNDGNVRLTMSFVEGRFASNGTSHLWYWLV